MYIYIYGKIIHYDTSDSVPNAALLVADGAFKATSQIALVMCVWRQPVHLL